MGFLRGYLIYRLFVTGFGALIMLIVAYCVVGRGVWDCFAAEKIYRQQYGEAWREHYQAERHATVEQDHRKIFIGTGGMVTMTVLCYLVFRQIAPRNPGGRRGSRRRRSRSPIPN
jgi:hypothetical protein